MAYIARRAFLRMVIALSLAAIVGTKRKPPRGRNELPRVSYDAHELYDAHLLYDGV